jgi:hypothetical protein
VKLSASFSPKRLGSGTTVTLGFSILRPSGEAPVAVTETELLLPAGLGVATSDLGLETCTEETLRAEGIAGCPANSLMGHGSALAEVPFGTTFVTEQTRTLLFSGPLREGHPELLMIASGNYPVIADIVFPALILPAAAPFGGMLDAKLPLVPSVPEGPDVALVKMQTTIGPSGITYYETVKGKRIGFRPRGILLPHSCPPGGFPFAVRVSFQDGEQTTARTAVPCPSSSSRRGRLQPRSDHPGRRAATRRRAGRGMQTTLPTHAREKLESELRPPQPRAPFAHHFPLA